MVLGLGEAAQGDGGRELGEAFGAARSDGLALYGYASHDTTTVWLGSSTGLRLRHVQPTGYVELTGKSSGGSSWVGQHTRDWTDVAVPSLDAEVRRRLAWGARTVELPAGRYETLLPPSAVADLMAYAYWTASGRSAAEGVVELWDRATGERTPVPIAEAVASLTAPVS